MRELGDVRGLQRSLADAGFDPGLIDGDPGPRTLAALLDFTAGRKVGERTVQLGRAMAREFPVAFIESRLRILHAVAQACHESGGFRYMQEIGGPEYFKRYDPGTRLGESLGNTEPGDGARFHGRGLIQITGRFNYARYGRKTGLDLVGQPELAAEPANAVKVFCAYWTDRGLNAMADRDDLVAITRAINGGVNGLAERRLYAGRIRAAWPEG